MHIVYCHTNKLNGKRYVGFTPKIPVLELNEQQLLERRWNAHCTEAHSISPLVFHKAIRKYGEEQFEHCVLEVCFTLEHVLQREIYWIAELHTTIDENGYNMTRGGEGNLMLESMKKAHAKATSEGTKKAFQRPEVREKWEKAMEAVNADPSVKKKRSESQKKAMSNPEVRAKISNSMKETAKTSEKYLARRMQIIQIHRSTMTILATYVSAREAERQTKIAQGNISRCARGELKHAGGYIWKYVEGTKLNETHAEAAPKTDQRRSSS